MSTIEEILSNTAGKEVIVAIDSTKRADYTSRTWYYTTHFRETGSGETPSNTPFPQYLLGGSLGPLSQTLSEDLFSGLASVQPGSLRLLQTGADEDDLSQLHDYIFAGHQVRVHIGLQSSATFDPSNTFPVFATFTVQTDPAVNATPQGIEAIFPLASAAGRLLKKNLVTRRHVGIPTGLNVLTTTGLAVANHIAAYNVTSFTLMCRIWVPSLPAASRNMFLKTISSTNQNFAFQLQTNGTFRATASIGGVATTLHTGTVVHPVNTWLTAVWSIQSLTHSYLMVNERVESEYTPLGVIDTQTANVQLARFLVGKHCDYQMYNRYFTPAEARRQFSARSEPASGCVGMWRFDDNAGSNANDYSASANDAAITGTENVDWKWDATDLGEAELAGTPYPVNVGEVFNVRAQLIDSQRQHLRGNVDAVDWHTSTSNTALAVKSRGTVLTGGGVDYTAPSDGGGGVFSTTSAEDEPITFDLTATPGDEATFFLPLVIEYLVNHRSLLVNSIDHDQTLTLYVLCPWRAGFHVAGDTTIGDALADLAGNSGLCYYENEGGDLAFDILRPPLGYGPYGGPCIDFRGEAASALSFGNVAQLSSSCTVACWFKAHVVSSGDSLVIGAMNLIAKPSSGAVEYALYIPLYSTPGSFRFRIAGVEIAAPAGTIAPETWYFAAATFDNAANVMKLFCAPFGSSLVEVASGANTGTPTVQSNPLKIGGEDGAPWMAVQHAQVWNVTKTLTELQALMDTAPVGNESGLLFYPPIDEGDGNPTDRVSGTAAVLIRPARWTPRLTVDLDVTPSVKLSDFHRMDPASEIVIQYARNWHPMDPSDIDTGVSQNDALDLKRAWKEVSATFPEIQDNYEQHKKVILPSALVTEEAATKLFSLIAERFSEDKWIGKLTFPPGLDVSARACALKIGDEIGIRASIPSQLQEARSFRVIAVAPDLLTLSTTVVFWG